MYPNCKRITRQEMSASRKRSCPSRLAAGGGEDRLSSLPDGVLGHILSFLPTKEAGRTAVLARRWRYMFAEVHTMSFEQDRVTHMGDDYTFYLESQERRSLNGNFLDDVCAAVLARRRCGGVAPSTSLRSFRLFFEDDEGYTEWDGPMVESLINHVLQQSNQELRLDLRFWTGEHCASGSDSDSYEDPWRKAWCYPHLPARLFRCPYLRSLRVGHCRLTPPEAVVLPSLETLHLTDIDEPCAPIQRLISGCPRLADLTLEACSKLKRVSVLHKRLRRLALRYCHNVVGVAVDASELTTLCYRGALPPESLLTLHGSPRIASCTMDICGTIPSKKGEFAAFRKLLGNFVDVKHLHLQSSRLGCGIESSLFVGFPAFSNLRRLELSGCLEDSSIVVAVAMILEKTPNLEALSLFLTPGSQEGGRIRRAQPGMSLPCLRQINLVHYRGGEAQRTLVKLLLRNALVLQELCVVFSKGPFALQSNLMNEMKGWAANKSAKMMFL
ncbi:hypothetical protein ACP70R_016743 [Stipagrostis hirtigluma subsp. patula]